MCGRTNLTATPEELAEAFDLEEVPELAPRYNIAPSQPMPVVRMDAAARKRRLSLVRWGLVPRWAADPKIGIDTRTARMAAAEKAYRKVVFMGLSCRSLTRYRG